MAGKPHQFSNCKIVTSENLAENVNDEYGERFHQYILMIEKRFKGKWNSDMLTNHCWNIKIEDDTQHKRVKRTNVV